MTLGEKLKQARLEAQLSQRQLCGDTITRNMLSQIENGSAKPSYATLQILSRRLGKPVSYFLEDAPSQNLGLLHQAQNLSPEEALTVLQDYLMPDPGLDEWYRLLTADCCIRLAQISAQEGRSGKAQALLRRAEEVLAQTPRFAGLYCRQLALLRHQILGDVSAAEDLPDNTAEQLLRARWALAKNQPEQCLVLLDGTPERPEQWHLLRADALIAMEQWQAAAEVLQPLEAERQVWPRLEQCYRELKHYEKAYYYACKQRETT